MASNAPNVTAASGPGPQREKVSDGHLNPARPDDGLRRPGVFEDRPKDQHGPAAGGNADQSALVPLRRRPVRSWPLLVLAAPAAVAVWSGWVGIGQTTGFGDIRPLPGIWNSLHVDTAVTLQ